MIWSPEELGWLHCIHLRLVILYGLYSWSSMYICFHRIILSGVRIRSHRGSSMLKVPTVFSMLQNNELSGCVATKKEVQSCVFDFGSSIRFDIVMYKRFCFKMEDHFWRKVTRTSSYTRRKD